MRPLGRVRDLRRCFLYFRMGAVEMNENKILAAILTIATSARETRGSYAEAGKENWRKAIKDNHQILTELDRDSVKKAS